MIKNKYYNIVQSGTTQDGIYYDRPNITGTIVSYRTGDDYYNLTQGANDYQGPSNPEFYQAGRTTAAAGVANFSKLKYNNILSGTDDRFTLADGTVCVYNAKTAATTKYVIDHLTGLGWYYVTGYNTWNTAVDAAHTSTALGYTDWRLPNANEMTSLWSSFGRMRGAKYVFDRNNFSEHYWTSTTVYTNTSQAHFINYVSSISVAGKTAWLRYAFCRNHYN